MAADTKIEWAHHTFNAWIGCTKVSPGCDHCYAERQDGHRRWTPEGWGGPRRRTGAEYWKQPLKWDRAAARKGERHRVFCSSLADVFDNQVDEAWRADLWKLIAATPHLDWLLLTKRPQNIKKMLPIMWDDGWPNVWLGTTAEDAERYRQRWHHVASVPSRIRFLSYEPALGHIGDLDLGRVGAPNWVICGGESGPGARPMHPDWARLVRDQCAAAGVAFHFKQHGEFADFFDAGQPVGKPLMFMRANGDTCPDPTKAELRDLIDAMGRGEEATTTLLARVGKTAAGRLLDGVQHDGVPV